MKEEKKKISDADNLQRRLYITFGWFIVSICIGLYLLWKPQDIGIGIVALSFLVFNVFTTLYNLTLLSIRRLDNKLEGMTQLKQVQSEIH